VAIYYTPRKTEVYQLTVPALVLIPLFALAIQAYLPLYWSSASLLDLPLLVLIYYGLTRRSPIPSMLAGAIIGIAQDSLTGGPIGLFGSAKTVIGYVTSVLSTHVDTESAAVRFLTALTLYGLHSVLFYLVGAILLGQPIAWDGRDRLIGALVNALCGVLLFKVLDRFRQPA